ncbi:MAG: Na/Pi cotransporter family protein [bacterium]|nr:Na/Pi cotransporter family protein [bacterium]
MDLFSIFTLCGGLAFFLYGISTMSGGLEKIAGGKLEKILKKMTSNPIKSFALGAGITALIQSSSAVTVMLVGLVNSGIMNLSQTVSVIIGSNVGTTITAWILSLTGIQGDNFWVRLLKPETFAPILALIGVIMIMNKNTRRKNIGTVLMGFAILMFGMEVMAGSMAPLADMPQFRNILVTFSTTPLLGMLVGLIVTMIIQSSSASIGILQALSLTSGISFGVAIPIILGQNLGSCISAVLSAIGVSTNAKRVAAVHTIYNIICVGVTLILFMAVTSLIKIPALETNVNPFSIAVFHTVYNIITALVFFPFFKALERAAVWAIPEKAETQKTVILDERLLVAPSFAITECYHQTIKMAELVEFNYINSTKMLKSYHKKKAEQIEENEGKIDLYEDKLSKFLLKLSGRQLSIEDSNRISQLLLAVGDYERIGDHTSHILKIAEKINESESKLSEKAIEELKVIVNAVSEMFEVTFEAYKTDNVRLAQEAEPLEAVIKKIIRKVKNAHIQRLKDGECTPELSFMFSDLLADLRRIAAHCGNVAISVIQQKDISLGKHEYNHRDKDEDEEYITKYQDYKSRFAVPKSDKTEANV